MAKIKISWNLALFGAVVLTMCVGAERARRSRSFRYTYGT